MFKLLKSFAVVIIIWACNSGVFAQPINRVYSIACHNCFEPAFAPSIEDVLSYTTNIELDIWDRRQWRLWGSRGVRDHDWFVRHDGLKRGNINCCGGSLRDCLTRVNAWSNQHKGHRVITIFIDKKENWSDNEETRKPIDLDTLLLTIFPREKIFTPAKMMKNDTSVRNAAAMGDWPLLDSLNGKIIFVITDATVPFFKPQNTILNEYLSARDRLAICFVAPEITSPNDIDKIPGISADNMRHIVVYNMKYAYNNIGPIISDRGFMSRVFNAPETAEVLNNLIASRFHFVAMYNYKLKAN